MHLHTLFVPPSASAASGAEDRGLRGRSEAGERTGNLVVVEASSRRAKQRPAPDPEGSFQRHTDGAEVRPEPVVRAEEPQRCGFCC